MDGLNNGRDEQAYTVYYSTITAPTTYINLTANDYKVANILTGASGWNNYPDSSRSIITAANGVLASNVYAVGFNFVTPNGENNWEGYSEIQVFGTVAAFPRLHPPTFSGGNLILSGTGGMPGGGYTCLTTTNVAAPLSAWTTNSQGTCNGSGAFSSAFQSSQIRPPSSSRSGCRDGEVDQGTSGRQAPSARGGLLQALEDSDSQFVD